MPTPGTPLHQAVAATFASAGIAAPAALVASISGMANVVLLGETDALGLMASVVATRMAQQGLVAALPLTLSPDVGDVGLVWREHAPGPALAAVLQAFAAENQAADVGQ
jgi:DNA-binding transcriptional LysR family regulator